MLAGLFVASLLLFALSARGKNHLTPLERAAVSAIAPFQNALVWTVDNMGGVWSGYVALVGVRQENELLRKKLDNLALDNAELREQLARYERMEKLLDYAPLEKAPYELARVVGKDTSGLTRLITIDKGSEHGLEENMTAMTHMGLVGRVIRTAPRYSKVMLITDVRSAVDALAQRTRDGMIAAGTNGAWLSVRYLKAGAQAADGDMVISSGLGGIFPKGLPIGALRSVKSEKDELFATASIVPMADLNRLEEVLVIKSAPAAGFVEDK